MVRTVNLDKNKHFSKMMNSVKQMKHEEDLCDFTIEVDKIELQAHKLILSAGSPYFKAMLKHDTIESQEGVVSMKGVDFECVETCVNFMYSGKFDIPDGKTMQLLHVAIMMQLDDVKNAICTILREELKPENFYETQIIAELYNLGDVALKCKFYYQENLMAISTQPEFQNETKGNILNLLKSKKFYLNEEEKMTLSLRWVTEKTQQKDLILELFNSIKIHEVSSEYLSDLLENHPLVSNDLRLYKMLNAFFVQILQNVSKTTAHESVSKNQIILFDGTSDCLRFFNPVTNEVTKTQVNELNHLESYSVVSIDSYIYILCEKSVHRLNLKNGRVKWERMRDMIVNRGAYPPCVSLSGSIFVIGCFSSPARKDVEVFNPFTNNWTKLNNKPRAVRLPTLVPLDESIYCIGGKTGTEPIKAFCRFTPLSSEWIDLEPMKVGKYGCGAAAVDQRIFVMGGRGSDGSTIYYTNDVECYDITMSQWTSLSPTSENPGLCVAHHFNGWIFLIGENSDKIEKYDIVNNTWVKVQLESYEIFNIANSVGPQVWNGGLVMR